VKAKEGSVFAINNKIFTVEKAILTFPGEPHKPILLDARASRQVEEYILYVAASGPVDNPRTRLESNPPLPSRDQLSLLVFDHLADKMTREEYVTATQKAMGVLGSLTAQKLKSLLGEDLPLLGDVSPTTSQEALGVGKKLSKDITVSYERKLNPLQGEDVNQIRLDYKIHKYFSAESQLGRKNTGGDLFFNIDF
jgi:translocation and assembly module TamB